MTTSFFFFFDKFKAKALDANHINSQLARASSPPPCLLTRVGEAQVVANL